MAKIALIKSIVASKKIDLSRELYLERILIILLVKLPMAVY